MILDSHHARYAPASAIVRLGGPGLLAAFLAIMLAGCVNHEKEVAIYRGVLDGHSPTTTRPAAQPCEAGTKLTLSEAMALAARDHERLAMSGETYLQALIDKDRAFANFLPTVSISPVFFQRERMHIDRGPQHTFDLPLVAQANLHTISDLAQLQGAALTAEQQRLLLLDLHSAVLLEVAQTYYAVLKAERSVEVLKNSLTVQEARVRDVADKLAQGVARRLDLEQSKAQAAATRVKVTEARRAAAVGRSTLAFLTGVPYIRGTLMDEYVTPDHADELEKLLAQAKEARSDLKAAGQAVLAARQGVEAAIGQYYPSVSVNVQGFLYRESAPEDVHLSGLLQGNLPLFSAGRIHADVRTAWSRFRQSKLAESLLIKQVSQQVEVERIEFTTSLQRIEDLQTEVAATREAFRISGESYNQGLATNLDRLDAQDRLLSAELRLAAEGFDKTVHYLGLRRVTGQLDGGNAGTSTGNVSSSAPASDK